VLVPRYEPETIASRISDSGRVHIVTVGSSCAKNRSHSESNSELKHAKFPYRVEHLKYAHAGHGAGMPQIIPMWHGLERHPISGREIDPGGSIQGNAASSIDAAPRVLQFLQQSFQVTSPAQAH
jgi:hypothetical protein